MGSFTFKWDKPAEEVYVTGTFDNWTKSVKLEKEGDVFQKKVDIELPADGAKIYYKFVVDNQWVLSDSSPKEPDHEGNDNNFLTAADLGATGASAAIINTVTPASTTAQLAGEQPLESKEDKPTPSDVPGGFPGTPADELNKTISVNPLPAAAGAINPIQLAPGEKIPESITAQSVNEHVKLDKESYEKSDALIGVDTELPPVSANIIPESSLPIGESKDVTINTVGAGATTAALAGQVPLEPKVPEVVKESQEKAGVEPEASAVPEEVEEKAKVEEELKEKVPEAPSTSEGTAGQGTEKTEDTTTIAAAATAAAVATGAAVVGAVIAAKDTAIEQAAPVVDQATATVTDAAKNLPEPVKEQLPASVQETLAAETKEEIRQEVSPEVPSEVKESLVEAGKSPEAAANTEAVQEKKEVEAELLKEVEPVAPAAEAKAEEPKVEEPKAEVAKPEDVAADVPPEVKAAIIEANTTPEAAANPEAVQEKKEVESELLKEVKPAPAAAESEAPKVEESKPEEVAAAVPAEVKESIAEAEKSPEAAANPEAVEDKKEVEAELLKEVAPTPAAAETKAEEPSEAAAAETKAEEPSEAAAAETPANGANGAHAANGANGSEAKPTEEASGSKPAEATTSAEKKKKHRISAFFDKLKSKFN